MKKSRLLGAVCALVSVLYFQTASATLVKLNFDVDLDGNTLIAGDLLNDVYGGLGVTFNASAAVRTGTLLPSLPNFATGSANDFTTDMELLFDTFAASVKATNIASSQWSLTVYDQFGEIFNTGIANALGETVIFYSTTNRKITKAVFSSLGVVGYGIDDLVFDTSPVPAPAAVWLFGSGLLGLIGLARRKART